MQVTWIIVALRTMSKWFWPSAGKSNSPGRPTATSPLSKPSKAVQHDAGADPEHPPAGEDEIPCEDLDSDNGTSGEQLGNGHLGDENRTVESSDGPPEPRSDCSSFEQGTPGSSSDSGDQLPTSSTEVDSEDPVATAPPLEDDWERCPTATHEHSDDEASEGLNDGNASAERPPESGPQPHDIGSRRSRQSPNPTPEPRSSSPSSRPELICRKNPASATWEITLTTDEECRLAAVRLDDLLLDHTAQGCSVPSLAGSLAISCQDGREHNIPLFDGAPLIFKMPKNWSGKGRRTAGITRGHFIVIVPATWERIGRPPVEPHGCTDIAFQAHYFHRDTTPKGLDGFHEWSGSLIATGIELSGQRVFDDSDEGDLFVGDAPSLKSSPKIVWARVGEEIENGWAQNFRPDEKSLPEVLGGREGRFFLRVYDVYDSKPRLLDSTAFRYSSNLKQIRVNGVDYTEDTALVPTPMGYPPTEVRFVSANGSAISAISPILSKQALQVTMSSGALEIPPHPDSDRILCSLQSDARCVDIVLDLPRIWWRLETGRPNPSEWNDTPIVMTRQEFRKHAYSNASMALLSRRFRSVHVGFDDEPAQPYRRLLEDDRITIPLTHFVDYAQIDQRLNEDARFNVEWAGKAVPLIVISADPMPEIVSFAAEPATIFSNQEATLEWTTRNAGDAHMTIDPDVGEVDSNGSITVHPTETTGYTLTLAVPDTDGIRSTVTVAVEALPGSEKRLHARVMSARGRWRCGKGFSFRELQDAGVTVKEAVERSLPIDRRRQTSHRANVESVRGTLDD